MKRPAFLCVAAALAAALPAHADGSANQAAAQSLFREAKDLWKAAKVAEACPKLEEVVRLEPQGNGARMMLAECYEATGRLASAWATYLAAQSFAERAGQAERKNRAKEKVDELTPKLSRMVVKVDAGLDDVPDLKLLRDGEVLGRAQWGTPVPVDGGMHRFEVRAVGYRTYKREVAVKPENDLVTIEIAKSALEPELAASSASAAPAAPPPVRSADLAPSPRMSEEPPAPGAPRQKTWPLPVAVGGGIALLAGVAFFVDQRKIESRQDELCGGDLKRCAATTPTYDPASDNGRKQRDFGLFVGLSSLGVAALGVAAYGAWGTKTQVAVGPGAVTVRGAF